MQGEIARQIRVSLGGHRGEGEEETASSTEAIAEADVGHELHAALLFSTDWEPPETFKLTCTLQSLAIAPGAAAAPVVSSVPGSQSRDTHLGG